MGLYAISAGMVFPKLVSWLKQTNKQTNANKQANNNKRVAIQKVSRLPRSNEYFFEEFSHNNTFFYRYSFNKRPQIEPNKQESKQNTSLIISPTTSQTRSAECRCDSCLRLEGAATETRRLY